MAIYHCSVKIISRSSGRSSVAAAAYRSGEKLLNQREGIEHDFTRKQGIEHSEIILPENAPAEYQSRETLWNAVELSEKRKDAILQTGECVPTFVFTIKGTETLMPISCLPCEV